MWVCLHAFVPISKLISKTPSKLAKICHLPAPTTVCSLKMDRSFAAVFILEYWTCYRMLRAAVSLVRSMGSYLCRMGVLSFQSLSCKALPPHGVSTYSKPNCLAEVMVTLRPFVLQLNAKWQAMSCAVPDFSFPASALEEDLEVIPDSVQGRSSIIKSLDLPRSICYSCDKL